MRWMQRRQPPRAGTEELARRHVAEGTGFFRISLRSEDPAICVKQPQSAARQRLPLPRCCPIRPALRISPPSRNSGRLAKAGVLGTVLVARKDNAPQCDPTPGGDRAGGVKICRKGLGSGPGLKWVEMRKCVGGDFLPGCLCDLVDQGSRERVGIVGFVPTHVRKITVVRQGGVGIAGP